MLDLLAYGALTGFFHSVHFHRRLRERERRALFLESNLAKAHLNTLKAQLQPHFLFNSLNAIVSLLRRDPTLAESTLVSLSGLLRLALRQSEKQEGTLREELEFSERYLEIQQVRFGERLRHELSIEPEALDCRVPTLVLQPLVENAIRHGIEPADRPGLVRVEAFRRGGSLLLTVEDDGVGLDGGRPDSAKAEGAADLSETPPVYPNESGESGDGAGAGTGIGLTNLRERLQALYGPRSSLQLMPRAAGGVVVRIEIPWMPQVSSESSAPRDS
jgi:sensor histidine kinase YesM